jgi:hypothetical protein
MNGTFTTNDCPGRMNPKTGNRMPIVNERFADYLRLRKMIPLNPMMMSPVT